MNRKQHFENIYDKKLWGVYGKTLSGRGSSDAFTNNDSKYISKIITQYNVKSIVDVCGDFAWQHKFLKDYKGSYIGVDISEKCLLRIKNKSYTFKQMDICYDTIPSCDLFIARDVLFHLTNEDIKLFLDNIRRSDVKFLMVTTFLNQQNKASNHDLTKPPFNLPLKDFFAGNKEISGYECKYLAILDLRRYNESLDE
jgi:hypothetical protein